MSSSTVPNTLAHRIRNVTRREPLAEQARLANDPISRLVGWLGKRHVTAGEGLILQPCSSIHMFGMRCAIDALYLDASGRVLHAVRNLRPWRIGPLDPRAACVVELPVGVLAATRTQVGDLIIFDPPC